MNLEKSVSRPSNPQKSEQEVETNQAAENTAEKETPKYSKEELLAIFDDIMFNGEYREEVTINGKLKVTFVTRSASATSAITRELDSNKFNLLSSMQQHRALLSICYSLVAYGNKDLSASSIEDRKVFIEKLPAVVVNAISNALVKFDLKTEAAMGEMDSF